MKKYNVLSALIMLPFCLSSCNNTVDYSRSKYMEFFKKIYQANVYNIGTEQNRVIVDDLMAVDGWWKAHKEQWAYNSEDGSTVYEKANYIMLSHSMCSGYTSSISFDYYYKKSEKIIKSKEETTVINSEVYYNNNMFYEKDITRTNNREAVITTKGGTIYGAGAEINANGWDLFLLEYSDEDKTIGLKYSDTSLDFSFCFGTLLKGENNYVFGENYKLISKRRIRHILIAKDSPDYEKNGKYTNVDTDTIWYPSSEVQINVPTDYEIDISDSDYWYQDHI